MATMAMKIPNGYKIAEVFTCCWGRRMMGLGHCNDEECDIEELLGLQQPGVRPTDARDENAHIRFHTPRQQMCLCTQNGRKQAGQEGHCSLQVCQAGLNRPKTISLWAACAP